MKNLLCLLTIMFSAFALKAQTCELRNNSAQNITVTVMAFRGGVVYITNPIPLSAATSMGPSTVASTSWPWSGATPPAGAYVIGVHVEVPLCSDVFDLDDFNTNHTSCPGPSQIDCLYQKNGADLTFYAN